MQAPLLGVRFEAHFFGAASSLVLGKQPHLLLASLGSGMEMIILAKFP